MNQTVEPSRSFTGFRWIILALIFFGTTFNYIDRLVISLLASDLQHQFTISDIQYGYFGWAFAIAYAIGQVFSGNMLDRIGTRLGYLFSLVAWSACAMATALGCGPWSFGIFRAALGLAESPSFPAAAKICAEWFPRRQRAFAFGFVNAGANMAAISTPWLVAWIVPRFGWQGAFIYTGSLGLILAAVWIPLYRRPELHPWVSKKELDIIQSDPPEPETKLPWRTIIQYRQAWVFAAGKFLSDGIWWFFITWLPKVFNGNPFKLDLLHVGWSLVIVFLMADMGSLGGGILSSVLIRRGLSINRARKIAMLAFATLALALVAGPWITSLGWMVFVVGLGMAAHQGFSSNIYTLCSDLFPKNAVASIAGFGGFCGYLGASLFQLFVGYWKQYTGNYIAPFICAGIAYILAVTVMHLISPDFQPADIAAGQPAPEETPD